MKILHYFTIIAIVFYSCIRKIERFKSNEVIENQKDEWIVIKTGKPVDGIVYENFPKVEEKSNESIESTIKSEKLFKNGRLISEKEFYANGALESEKIYSEKSKLNQRKLWSESGQLLIEENFKNGDYFGWQRTFSSSGKSLGEVNLVNGNGKYIIRFENGRINMESNYKNGKLNGIYRVWDIKNKLECDYFYINDIKEGICQNWHSNGQLASKEFWKSGKIETEECYDPYGNKINCSKLVIDRTIE